MTRKWWENNGVVFQLVLAGYKRVLGSRGEKENTAESNWYYGVMNQSGVWSAVT